MKKKSLAAAALMAALAGTAFAATASAADGIAPESIAMGTAVYTEDFDSADSITAEEVLNSQKGWTTEYGQDTNGYYVGGYDSFGSGNVLDARMNTWCTASKSILDIKDNAAARGGSIDWDSNRMALSLDFIIDPADLTNVGNLQNGAEHKLKIKNDYGDELINIDARMSKENGNSCRITINIINEGEITYVTDTDFSSRANKVYNKPFNLKVYRDGDVYGGKILILINGEPIAAPDGGVWHTVNGSVNLQKIEIENWWSNWYGGVAVDNISLAPWGEKSETVSANRITGGNENGVFGDYNYAAAFLSNDIAIDKIKGNKYTWVVDDGTKKYAKEFEGSTELSGTGNVVIGLVVTDIDADSDLSAKLYVGTLEETQNTIKAE